MFHFPFFMLAHDPFFLLALGNGLASTSPEENQPHPKKIATGQRVLIGMTRRSNGRKAQRHACQVDHMTAADDFFR